MRLHECDIFSPNSLEALARLAYLAEQNEHSTCFEPREFAVSYGFRAEGDLIIGTDMITIVSLGSREISWGHSSSTESAVAIAALLGDPVFAETITQNLDDLPLGGFEALPLDGRFDAICMSGGIVLEVFDEYWPYWQNVTSAQMDRLTLRRFYAICHSGQSQHARMEFRARARRYIENHLHKVTTTHAERSSGGFERQTIEFVENM